MRPDPKAIPSTPTPGRRRPAGRAPGFTLIELSVSLAVSTILMLALGSAVMLASRGMPGADDPATISAELSAAADTIADELATATAIRSWSSTQIRFQTADITGDGRADELAYAWSGTPGDALARTENGSAAELSPPLDRFQITLGVRRRAYFDATIRVQSSSASVPIVDLRFELLNRPRVP